MSHTLNSREHCKGHFATTHFFSLSFYPLDSLHDFLVQLKLHCSLLLLEVEKLFKKFGKIGSRHQKPPRKEKTNRRQKKARTTHHCPNAKKTSSYKSREKKNEISPGCVSEHVPMSPTTLTNAHSAIIHSLIPQMRN